MLVTHKICDTSCIVHGHNLQIAMATNCVRHISLEINCGFARTAIRELTPKNGQVDKQQRACKFKKLYDGCSGFVFGAGYFDDETKNGSMFSRDCTKTLQAFNKKWHIFIS